MPATTKVVTALPASVDPALVVRRLHDHELYIKTTCPQLISYHQVSGPQSVSSTAPSSSSSSSPPPSSTHTTTPSVYEITDKRPIGQTTYTLTLTDTADGLDSRVDGKAPTGGDMVIVTRWRVKTAGEGGKGEEAVLEENVEIESNMLMSKMIRGNVEKSHPGHHRLFVAEASAA